MPETRSVWNSSIARRRGRPSDRRASQIAEGLPRDSATREHIDTMYLHWPRPMCNVDLSPVPVTKAAAADFVLLEQVERFPLRAQSVRRPAAKQMPVAVLGHPAGASEVCFPGAPGAFGLAVWIEVQHDPCDLGPSDM